MVRRRISEAQRWQIIGMHTTGMSFKAIGRQMGYHYTVDIDNTFGTMWLEFKEMAQDPLVRREPVSASCNRRPDEGLETQKYSQYPKEHPANCPLRWRLSNGLGVYLS